MRSPRLMWLGVGVAVLVAFAGPGGAAAAGPWRATIVDAETGKPLEGVVVVAAFAKYTKGLAGLAGAWVATSGGTAMDPPLCLPSDDDVA